MRPITDCTRINGSQVCLDPGDDSWIDLADGNTITGLRQHGAAVDLQSWEPGQAVENLGRRPTVVHSDIGMREALQIRYHTGNKLVLQENNKLVGILGDSELYHALLGKNHG
jgi:glycine betaine/proline transport system ATP-binding protein